MAGYQFTSDLVRDALFGSGEPTDGTSDYHAKALDYVNRAYNAICMGGAELEPTVNEEWSWLLSPTPATLTLEPVIEAGTVTVTNGSTAVVFSAPPAMSVAGWFFRPNNTEDIFRIAAHTAGNANATLDSVFTTGNLTGAGYSLFKLEYALAADVLRLISPMRIYRNPRGRINGAALDALEKRYPLRNVQTGIPREFAQIGTTTVRFSHAGSDQPGDYIRVDYDYLKRPATLTDSGVEEPLLPIERRRLLADFATYFLMVDKNDDRADAKALIAKAGLRAMAHEHRRRMAGWTDQMGHISPRQQDLPANFEVVRTDSGMIVG